MDTLADNVDENETQEEKPQKLVYSLPVDHSGTVVYVKGWKQPRPESAPVLIVHDLGENSTVYKDTLKQFADNGFSAYCYDLRGHGRSGRRLGHSPSFHLLCQDLLQVAAWVRHLESGARPIVFGHGMGALIALHFLKQYPAYALGSVLSAPSFSLNLKINGAQKFLFKVLNDVAPTMRLPRWFSPPFARVLTERRKSFRGEGRYYPKITARFTNELVAAMESSLGLFLELHERMLVLCPEEDAVNNYRLFKQKAAVASNDRVQIQDLPNVGHHYLTENQSTRTAALKYVLPWLRDLPETKYALSEENAPVDSQGGPVESFGITQSPD